MSGDAHLYRKHWIEVKSEIERMGQPNQYWAEIKLSAEVVNGEMVVDAESHRHRVPTSTDREQVIRDAKTWINKRQKKAALKKVAG